MTKIAILSAWHVHAKDYAAQVAARPDCEICVVWDNEEARGKAFAASFGVPFEPDLDRALLNYGAQAAVVTTSTDLHKEVMGKCAQYKKHVFTEKVLAFTVADCMEIKKALEENDVLFTISYPQMSNGINRFIKQTIDSGELGQITYARVRDCHGGAVAGWLPPHFFDKSQCGGGAMMDLGAHPMYLLRWFLGKPASISSAFHSITGKPVEDNAVSLIEFDSKAIGVAETSFVSSGSVFTVEIQGTQGQLRADIHKNTLTLKRASDPEEIVLNSFEAHALPSPLDLWAEGLKEGKNSPFGLDLALELTELMQGAYLANSENRKVQFSEIQ